MRLHKTKKNLHDYYASVNHGKLAVKRGYFLNNEDIAFRQYIKDISCKGATVFQSDHLPILEEFCFPQIEQLAADGLLEYDKNQLKLKGEGHYFIRNICSAFDLYLQRDHFLLKKQTYSKAI
jgi:oxygen-independent coproporphyrinogen-3 oxidase